MTKEDSLMVLTVPDELQEEFVTFLEIGLASVTAYLDELTQSELRLVEILKKFLREHQEKEMEL